MFKLTQPEKIPLFMRPTILKNMYGLLTMCLTMSVLSSILFKHPWGNFIPTVLTTLTFNSPMAFFVQIFLLGPLLKRLILDN